MPNCRAGCPWSVGSSQFADVWWKLCNRRRGHDGKHSNGVAIWDDQVLEFKGGRVPLVGYSDTKVWSIR